MKRCDSCILKQLDPNEFSCKGELQAPECIGVLQGVIEKLATNRFMPEVPAGSCACRLDYSINGEGSVYLRDIPSDEEIAVFILEDCSEKEIGIEYLD